MCYPFPTVLRHARSFVEHVVKAPKADEAAQATVHFRSRLAGNPKPKTNRSLNPNPNPNPYPRKRQIFKQADETTHTIPSLPPCGFVWL